ncbi:MAG: DUF433 domain-containing protein [Oxalobacter sp.]|nr:DUF433 domain-containing protein [Oxalobacter sp.]
MAAKPFMGFIVIKPRINFQNIDEFHFLKNINHISYKSLEGDMMAIGTGAYNLQEAARYTGIKATSIARWLFSENPLWTHQLSESGWRGIGFYDLLELRIVQRFKSKGVSLQAIRLAIKNAKELYGGDYPLINKRFHTDGKNIFSEAIGKTGDSIDALLDLKKRQLVLDDIIRPSLDKGIVYAPNSDNVILWYPDRRLYRGVVLDPKRSFGKPIIDSVGIKTSTLYGTFLAEEDKRTVAKIYDVPISAVNAAIKYEEGLDNRIAA